MKQTPLTAISQPFPGTPVKGILQKRYKRFLADVLLEDNSLVVAHCPNSGAMTGCAEPGMPVLLSHHHPKGRRTAYTWEMAQTNKAWICVNTNMPNRLAVAAARAGVGDYFAGNIGVQPEVKINQHTRLDLLVKHPKHSLYVEVKSVTLRAQDYGCFPDAPTLRGQKHLKELMALKAQGHQALMLYLVGRPDVHAFTPARHIDPAYAAFLEQAVAVGVDVLVWQIKAGPQGLRLWRELPWDLHGLNTN